MAFSGGGIFAVHDDSWHQDSAKRDAAGGVAGLDGSGSILATGRTLYLTRDVNSNIFFSERTSIEQVFYFNRVGVNDYIGRIVSGGAFSVIQLANMKNAASGIAGLDASTKITARLAYENVASGIAGLDASTKIAAALLNINVANGIAGLDASTKIVAALLNIDVASGIAGLNASTKVISRLAYENVASGVAVLDANTKIAARLAYENVASGVAVLDASSKIASRLAYENVASGVAVLDASSKIASRLAYENAASGVAGLDANSQLAQSVFPGILNKYVIGDAVLYSHNTAISNQNNSAYAKKKTITITGLYPSPSTLRISYWHGIQDTGTSYSRIYKNGAGFGTQHSVADASEATFVEDLSFADGDTIELWAYVAGGTPYYDLGAWSVKGSAGGVLLADAINNSNVGLAVPFTGTNSVP